MNQFKQGRNATRRGLAPVEILLWLPLMTFLWLMIFSVGGAGFSCMVANTSARREAWQDRAVKTTSDELSLTPSGVDWNRLLDFNDPLTVNAGLIRVDVSETFAPALPTFANAKPTVKRKAFVLCDPWDADRIHFPKNRLKQPPLTVSPHALEFVSRKSDAKILLKLLD